MHPAANPWYEIGNVADVPSPALLIYPERVEENIRRMLRIAPPERLRPHIKTHKMPELVRMQMAHQRGRNSEGLSYLDLAISRWVPGGSGPQRAAHEALA